MPLNIYQIGQPKLALNAHFQTEPFTLPVYWDLRLGRGSGSRFMELELIHHKLYLTNTTAEVQKFNVSHGFNMLLGNYGVTNRFFRFSLGVGLVVAHPESKIRNREFGDSANDWDMGYYLTGPVLASGVDILYRFTNKFYVALGGRITAAYARLPVSEGYSRFINLAGHLSFGLGIRLK